MYTIDKLFNNLINEIESKSVLEIYMHIRNNYQKLLPATKEGLESFFTKFPYWGALNHNKEVYDELYNRALSLKNNVNEFTWLYTKLSDYRSKKVLYAIINNWYNFDFKHLSECRETNYSHYFDLDILKCDENEVFVDLGAYTGDTIIDYINSYGPDKYKKIICYEITPENLELLKNNLANYDNIDIRFLGVSDEERILYINKSIESNSANTISEYGDIEVTTTTLDKDIINKITLIKMDIEGSEQAALRGAVNHIVNDKPKLAISVYHNHKDIIEIPKMINEMNNEYRFYLRYYGNSGFPTEVVLLAI